MKMEFHAKIVGHELFAPDPKDTKHMGIRVKLSVASMQPTLGKPTKGVLPIEVEQLADFPIGRFLKISVVETQLEIEFTPAKPRNPSNGELAIVPPAGETKTRRGRKPAETEPLH